MSDEADSESDDRMGRADRIRNTREGRRDSSRRSRSGDSESSASDESTSEEQTAQTSQHSQRTQRNEQGAKKQPVKQRPHRTIYLPGDLDDEFESVIDRLQYETKSEEGVKLAKNRHTYPLIVYLGLERASDMTPDEVLTTLTETDILDTPEL